MSTDTQSTTATDAGIALDGWQAGLAGGLLGGLLMGLLMATRMEAVLEMAIPAMYGIEGPALAVGVGIHLLHSLVLGLVFAIAVEVAGLRAILDDNATLGAGGLVYGVALWVVLAVLVMPVWLDAAGFGMAPEVPNVDVQSLVGHVVYGTVLGVAYSVLAAE